MPPKAPLSFYDRGQLAMRVYNAVAYHTDDLATLANLATVMGALLRADPVTPKDLILIGVLEAEFAPDNRLWELVQRPK